MVTTHDDTTPPSRRRHRPLRRLGAAVTRTTVTVALGLLIHHLPIHHLIDNSHAPTPCIAVVCIVESTSN